MRVISLMGFCTCTCIIYRQCFSNILMPLMKFRWPLYSDNIFIVDHYSAGVSNKHCLWPFLLILFHYATCLCILQWFLKSVKMIIFK